MTSSFALLQRRGLGKALRAVERQVNDLRACLKSPTPEAIERVSDAFDPLLTTASALLDVVEAAAAYRLARAQSNDHADDIRCDVAYAGVLNALAAFEALS